MKVLIFAAYYYPHTGGYEKNVHELGKRLVQKGHEVYVLTCNTGSASIGEVKDGVGIWRVPSWNLLGGTFPIPKPSKELVTFLRRMGFDVVVTQTRFFITSLLGMVFAKAKKIPLIHVERGTCHSVVPNRLVSLIAKTYDHTFGRMVVKAARVNVGVSKAACDFVGHLGGNRTEVIYNGIGTGVDRHPHDTITITFVGRLIYAKGVQDLMEAFADSWKLHSKIKLFIVGDGNYRQELEILAGKLRCCGSIKFLGEKSSKGVMDTLGVTDIFVNPSYSEGLPTSVMEAASVGLPIVATDVGGTREVIRNGVSGIIVKPHKPFQMHRAIEWLLSNPVEAKTMGLAAKVGMNHKFDWNKITDQYEKLLKEAMNAR